jgi:hypothetical protein
VEPSSSEVIIPENQKTAFSEEGRSLFKISRDLGGIIERHKDFSGLEQMDRPLLCIHLAGEVMS